jgi:DNA/RNA endonuclease G (NUC1)
LIPKCIKNPSAVSWRPKPNCELESCGTFSIGYYKFPVDLKARLASSISVDMNLYYVAFDSQRKLPIYVASYIDLTTYAKVMKRVNGFTVHPCAELNGKQAKNDDFKMTPAQLQQCNPKDASRAWDRGHLAPNALFTFNKKAALTSNFFVNIAPQDPFTNQVFERNCQKSYFFQKLYYIK